MENRCLVVPPGARLALDGPHAETPAGTVDRPTQASVYVGLYTFPGYLVPYS